MTDEPCGPGGAAPDPPDFATHAAPEPNAAPAAPEPEAAPEPKAAPEPNAASAAPEAASGPRVVYVVRGAKRDPASEPIIASRSRDDSDVGWGDGDDSNDQRLLGDVPPHW